ncbi:MAG TPA: aldose 1-epimerase family protein [Solirubrobacteraceae bacterium]
MSGAVPSGEQFEIAHGEQRATIVEVGGGIREYAVGERPVLDPYPAESICDGAHGMPLIPWPNRLRDGRYSFEGEDYRLSLTEPEAGNAIHGLLRWRNWRALERAPDRVVVGTRLNPMPGWPFPLDVAIGYSLGEDGLTVQTSVTNIGSRACPLGSGQHPYLSAGPGWKLDECRLQLKAGTRVLTDPDRQLPTGTEPVHGTDLDFRAPRMLQGVCIDDPFTDLERDRDGLARVGLSGPDGHTVELWCDSSYRVIQLYTGDTLAVPRRRLGLAAEPMTCPPNALQSGEGLIRLEPGRTDVSRWGVRLI